MFGDLDDALFGGALRGNVYLEWFTAGSPPCSVLQNVAALTCPCNACRTPDGITIRRIYIGLNADILLLDARRSIKDVVNALVHEMIVSDTSVMTFESEGLAWHFANQKKHAYLLLLAGTLEDPSEPVDKGHGVKFVQCMAAVNRTLRRHTGFSTSVIAFRLDF